MPDPQTTLNSAAISALIETRHGLKLHYREVYKRMTRRRTMRPPVAPVLKGYRTNGVAWPLDQYLVIEAYLLDTDVAELPPVSQADLLLLRGLGYLADASVEIAEAADIINDQREALPAAA